MKKSMLCLLLAAQTLSAAGAEPAQKSETYASLQYEYMDFSGSRQKEEGNRGTLSLKHRQDAQLFRAAIEKTETRTFKPPLKEDLDVTKFYVRYTAEVAPGHSLHAGFITIRDNLVPTDKGNIYGLGYTYRILPGASVTLNGYYSDYAIFDAYQVDVQAGVRRRFGAVDAALQLIGKTIVISDCTDAFCANAAKQYFAPGVKMQLRSGGFFVHAGALFGRRVFAVMQDGMMVQHHAMEFEETYMAGVGKRWGSFDVTLRYVYQKATELPLNNEGVIVRNSMVRLGYYF